MRRADRLFQIVQLLRARRLVTGAELARELEVSARTIYRDVADLVASGVPVEGEAGVGYALACGFDLPPLMFDAEEIGALVLGARMVQAFGDEALARRARSVLTKVEAVVPERLRKNFARPEWHVWRSLRKEVRAHVESRTSRARTWRPTCARSRESWPASARRGVHRRPEGDFAFVRACAGVDEVRPGMASDPPIPSREDVAERATPLGSLLTPETQPRPQRAPPASPTPLPSAATAELTPHAAFLVRRRFAALDGLRALGILAVVWHHTVGGPGRFGANLFFLLSGFLVTTALVRERARKGTIDVLGFRTRRARRLYPLYFTVLAGYVGLVALLEPAGAARDEFFAHLPAFASFTSNLFVDLEGQHTIFYFAWSLAAQEQFYLLWPWLLKRASARACAGGVMALLSLVYLTRAGTLDLVLPDGGVARALVLSVMPALALGTLLALALDTRRGFEVLRRWLGSRWTSCALLALALLVWRTPSVPEALMHVVLTALTAACVLREDHALARVLRLPALVHVGTVSYGIYLLHMLCHNAAERVLARLGGGLAPLDFVLTGALAIAVATLSHRHFEPRFLAPKRARGSSGA